MITALRDYQQELYIETRTALMKHRAVCVQSATGSGKTPLVSEMVSSVNNKNKRAWFIVPRKELLTQGSNHFRKWGVPHGIISANSSESKAYKIHVVSKDTLIRRYDKIKNWPDLLIMDEAHLYLDRQKEIISHLPESSKIIGLTATPERLDGRGLSIKGGGVYDTLIIGKSISYLTERDFLSPLRYFSPPIDGLKDLHVRGTDYDEEELEDLLKKKKIYGELVGHYEKHGKGKAALIFCRSVKQAYQTAEKFRDKGFNFHCIEGNLSDGRRKELIHGLTNGTIDGLTNCDLCTYGLDIPRVEYGASIRPTLSRALYMQMIGRIIRPYQTDNYKKEEALFFDHVNMICEHQDDNYPGMPLHYVPEITWNFDGTEKRKRDKKEIAPRLCPHIDFMYCDKPNCLICSHNPDKSVIDVRPQPIVIVPTDLQEIEKPIAIKDRPPEERRELQDKIGKAIHEYDTTGNLDVISDLIKIQESCGYNVLWTYWKLTPAERLTINYPVLHAIAKAKGYKPAWVKYGAEPQIKRAMGRR